MIVPQFSLTADTRGSGSLLSIRDADIGYHQNHPVLKQISLSMHAGERVALCGNNASGKSTLLKAILNQVGTVITGL